MRLGFPVGDRARAGVGGEPRLTALSCFVARRHVFAAAIGPDRLTDDASADVCVADDGAVRELDLLSARDLDL